MPKFRTTHAFGARKRRKKMIRGREPAKDAPKSSFSVRKNLANTAKTQHYSFDRDLDEPDPYLLLHVNAFSKIVGLITCECGGKCTWQIVDKKGYASCIDIVCASCTTVVLQEKSSPQVEIFEGDVRHEHHDINNRAVLIAHETAIHYSGLVKVMALLGVQGSISKSSYRSIAKQIYHTTRELVDDSLKRARIAVKEKHMKDSGLVYGENDVIDIPVTFDGTWHKRGHTSLYGIGFCLDGSTGLVLDLSIKSKYCHGCSTVGAKLSEEDKVEYERSHKCQKNFSQSSGKMEVDAALDMWKRSVSLGFRYTTLISDGDSAVFTKLNECKPYGEEVTIEKEECINHIQKRMYSSLDRIVKQEKAKKFTMGGKHPLTHDRMKKWGHYYRNAIVEAAPDPELASKKIWAILKHSTSSQDAPDHEYCEESWCFYKQRKAAGDRDPIIPPKSSDKPLSKEIKEKLIPVFERLADKTLISRCMSLRTQNANESLHSTVWARCPKTKFVGYQFLENAVYTAVRHWNDGAVANFGVLGKLKAEPSSKLQRFVKEKDVLRIAAAKRGDSSKLKRKKEQLRKVQEEENDDEGLSYAAGMF